MRPAGEVHLAMLQAAHAIKRERLAAGQGATLREMAGRACVGYAVARATVANLRRSGRLSIVGECKVAGRNRPAALYAPAVPAVDLVGVAGSSLDAGAQVLQSALMAWSR